MDQVQIKLIDSDASMDRETLAMLAGTSTAGLPTKPITPGVIALLDLIDSPLVTGGDLSMLDLYRALYVIHAGPDAVAPVLRAVREQQTLQKAEEHAGANVDMFAVYCGALRASAAGWNEFDAQATRYAIGLGAISHEDISAHLRQAINIGTAGFRMIDSATPGPETAQKKSTHWGLSGLLDWSRQCARRVLLWILMP